MSTANRIWAQNLAHIADIATQVRARDYDNLSDASLEALGSLARIANEGAARLDGAETMDSVDAVPRGSIPSGQPAVSEYSDAHLAAALTDYGIAPMPSLAGSPRDARARVEQWFKDWMHRPTPTGDYTETCTVHEARRRALRALDARALAWANGNDRCGIGWLGRIDVATYNALLRAHVSRVEELEAMTDEQLDELPRIGPTRIAKIRLAVADWKAAR